MAEEKLVHAFNWVREGVGIPAVWVGQCGASGNKSQMSCWGSRKVTCPACRKWAQGWIGTYLQFLTGPVAISASGSSRTTKRVAKGN